MKKMLVLASLLLWTFPLSAERLYNVSFNPSRMGEYTYLKVTDKANLKGGLNATTLTGSSGGTVTMTADGSPRIYDVPTVTGETGSSIDMPNTVFHGNTNNTYSAYKSENTATPSGLLPNVNVKGGTQTYNNDSYIQTLDAVNMLKQKVGTLKGGTLEITGNGGSSVNLYESGNTAGFYLAGNDIPEPTSAHTNTSTNLTGCQLVWEKRKTSESPAKEVYLLALQGCNGAATPPDETTSCSDSSYKLSHKSECCPSIGPGDTDCWHPQIWMCEDTGRTSGSWVGDYCGNFESASCSQEGAVQTCSWAGGDNTIHLKECSCDHARNGW